MRLGALLTSRTVAFAPCCYLAEGFLPLLVVCGRRKESAKSNPRPIQRSSMMSLKEPRSRALEPSPDRLVLDPMVSSTIHNA